jgi:tetratricopeptide (TPR) repeat protein
MIHLLLLAALAAGPDAQPPRISTSGWCSPVFVDVKGPVNVTCKGVDPRALAVLNRNLGDLKLNYKEKVAEANDWAERYHSLQDRLKEESIGSEMARQAEDDLSQGKLDEAVAVLKQLTATKDKENVDRSALHNYETGLALEMQFKTPDAIPYLEEAQQIRPHQPEYACEYARVLVRENRYADARAVYDRILPWLDDQGQKNFKFARVYMIALHDAAQVYSTQGDVDRAEEAENKAFFQCMALEALQETTAGAQCNDATLFMIAAGLGTLEMQHGQLDRAERMFTQAFNVIKANSKNGTAYLPEQADLLTKLGLTFIGEEKYPDAQKTLSMAYSIQKLVLNRNDPDTRFNAAVIAAALGLVHFHQQDFDRGEDDFREAAESLRELALQDPEAYQPVLEHVLYQWAQGEYDAHRLEQARPLYEEVLPLLQKFAAADPAKYLSDLSATYGGLAVVHDQAKDYEESLRLIQLSVEASRKTEPTTDNLEMLGKSLCALTLIAKDAGQIDLAETSADESEQILRKLYGQNSQSYSDSFVQTLIAHGIVLSAKHDCDGVSRRVTEATRISPSPKVTQVANSIQSDCHPAK